MGASLNPNTITVGQESTFKFKIRDTNPAAQQVEGVTIQVSGGGSCTSNCSPGTVELTAGVSDEIQAKIKGNSAGQASVKVVHSGGQIGSVPLTITSGQQESQYVGLLRGEVRGISDGKGIPSAVVTVQDPSGKSFDAKTNSSGTYQFDGKALKIAPGTLIFAVTKDPFVLSGGPKNVDVRANENKQIPALVMENPTATTAPPTNTGPPTSDPSASGATAGPVETKAAADSGGLDTMTWIMIIVGGLLVALGIGAIVLLLVRRNSEDDDEEDEEDDDEPVRGRPTGPRGPAGAARPAAGVYGGAQAGATAVYGRPADQTMIQRPGMNDAPTQMHRPGVDQYGNPTQVYGQPPQSGWGPPPQQPGYGAPSSGGGYGQASGGGAYGAPPNGGYGQASGGGAYGAPPNGGYSQSSGGGAYGDQASGGGAYGGQASGGGAYGAPPPQQPGWGGYDQQPGYGQPGYAQPGQYEEPTQYAGPTSGGYGAPPPAGPTSGGYGAPPPAAYDGGYGQQPGYGQPGYTPDPYGGGAPQQDPYGGQQQGYGQQQGHPDDRRNPRDRRLDWLDD